MATATFDPLAHRLYVGSLMVDGYHDDMISVEYNEDAFSLYKGADGKGTRVRNRNESGKLTVTLAQSSPLNSSFSALHNADKLSGLGKVPFMLKDLRGTLLLSGSEAWIMKMTPISIGKEIKAREWVFEIDKLVVTDAGAAVL